MAKASKYDKNQLWPKKHIMPRAIMTQDWKAGVELEP